jgi:dTDP-N-acetylfucosamine:lipid II N-acetylfucosaminyltransferase
MNVHIAPDNKFYKELLLYIDENELSENNLFVVFPNGGNHSGLSEYENKFVFNGNYNILLNIVLNECVEKIIVHNLSSDILLFLDKYLRKGKRSIYWLSWGSDFHAYAGDHKNFLDKYSDFNDKRIKWLNYSRLKIILKETFIYDAFVSVRKLIIGKQISVINYYCVWNLFEFNLIEKMPFQNMEYRYFAYFSYSQIRYNKSTEPVKRMKRKKIKILVGHSGYNLNNHVSAFEIIKKSKIINGDVEIYAQLAYGDKNYINYVRQKGREYFGDKFVVHDKFMAHDEYVEFLMDIDIVYMNNVMVAGVANVAINLKIGNCLVMRKENEFYNMLQEKKAKIFLAEDVFNDIENGSGIILSENEKNKNIEIINEIFNLEKVRNGYDMIVR